jgi:hypothetical protein
MALMIALTSVVLPEPVPPITRMFRCALMAAVRVACCAAVMIPASTYCSSVKMATAFLRMAKVGAGTTGGSWPAKREPSIGSSPSRIGLCRVTSLL